MHPVFDRFDLLSQHDELCPTQAVHYKVVAVDKVVQIFHIPKTKVEIRSGQRLHQWFCSLVFSHW